jgi:hypothetical protein
MAATPVPANANKAVNLRVVNEGGKARIHVPAGTEVTVVADPPAADGKGGPADQNKTTTGQGNGATVPLDGSKPAGSVPTAGGPTGQKLDDTHRSWHSVGDPHIKMGNENFDNMQRGDFVIAQSQDKSFQVQARQEQMGDNQNVTVNTAAAVKDGDNVVAYDAKTKKLTVNGAEWDGKTQPQGGTKIEKIGDGYSVTSSKGDVTNIHDKGGYLDLDGKLGPDRVEGEVRGAHGVFDNTDGSESHIKRDGTRAANRDEMINDWKVKPEEDLFAAAGKGGPADPNKPVDPANPKPADPNAPKPADPNAPADGKGGPGALDDATKTALKDIMDQLNKLVASLGEILKKLGVDAGAAAPAPAPADGKGGPAPAAQPKKDDKAAPAATFEDQKKADAAAKAAEAPKDGKGGPAPADAAGGDIFAQITTALKGLMELLQKLLAQLGGNAAPIAPAADAAKPAADAAGPAAANAAPKAA